MWCSTSGCLAPPTKHFTSIERGKKLELHLCDACWEFLKNALEEVE